MSQAEKKKKRRIFKGTIKVNIVPVQAMKKFGNVKASSHHS
jgi:hypothetical protein